MNLKPLENNTGHNRHIQPQEEYTINRDDCDDHYYLDTPAANLADTTWKTTGCDLHWR